LKNGGGLHGLPPLCFATGTVAGKTGFAHQGNWLMKYHRLPVKPSGDISVLLHDG
jgi:hypothetical protein